MRAASFSSKPDGIHQIVHAQADARGFVAVGGADAAFGGADFIFALDYFALGVQFAVIGKTTWAVSLSRKFLAATLTLIFLQSLDFGDEAERVDDHAVADDAQFIFPQDARRDQVQDVFFFADENGVPGVVAAGIADDDVRVLGEHVNDFAFAFVAPLGADENCIRHN